MLTMVHGNGARIEGGRFKVDRKFHAGMQSYVAQIGAQILSVHPESAPGTQVMDPIEIPIEQLGYRVMTVQTDRLGRPLLSEIGRLRDQISQSRLLYDGSNLRCANLARSLGVPYILILEQDLKTKIVVSTSEVSNALRRGVRTARCVLHYAMSSIPDMRGAHSLHCNGYPIYDESRWFNPNRLLYLDSRMSADLIIPEDLLKLRLSGRAGRPIRMLFSGRYEPLKGADHAVRVAKECIKRGLSVELDCYGQGSLRAEMDRLAAKAVADGALIRIHDAIPYPKLVEISRNFDLFVCCHIQNDPSCTYLESFGAGLPVVGYGNRMWRRLNEESQVGFCSPLGQPEAVADDIQKLSADFETLATMSERARRFAMEHSFEREFTRRTDALNGILERSPASE